MINHEAFPKNPFEGYEDVTENIRIAKSQGWQRGKEDAFEALVEWLKNHNRGTRILIGDQVMSQSLTLDSADWQSLLKAVEE